MNTKIVLVALLLISVFVTGCSSKPNYQGYAAYNSPQGQPQGQYVGGGCGVAPAGDYESTPIGALSALNGASSQL